MSKTYTADEIRGIEPAPNFHLSRMDAATLMYALGDYQAANGRAARRTMKATRYVPGKAAGYAAAAGSAQEIRERVMRFMVDNGWLDMKPEKTTA